MSISLPFPPFKLFWHEADLTPGARERWEAQRLIKSFIAFNTTRLPYKYLPDLRFLDVHPSRYRRMVSDMEEVRAAMIPFFPSSFTAPEKAAEKLKSPPHDQMTRAQQLPPNVRSRISNKYRSKKFFEELKALKLPQSKAYTSAFKGSPRSRTYSQDLSSPSSTKQESLRAQ